MGWCVVRDLVWAFALTFAATSASGGSFTGFPSLIYTHGWILALWIASYMMVPVLTMGLLGKRLNQVARRAGAITVPDVIRGRFESAGNNQPSAHDHERTDGNQGVMAEAGKCQAETIDRLRVR